MAQDETSDERRNVGPGDAPGLEAFNALLRRTLALPPKPHSEMKLGKPRGRKPKARQDHGTDGSRPGDPSVSIRRNAD